MSLTDEMRRGGCTGDGYGKTCVLADCVGGCLGPDDVPPRRLADCIEPTCRAEACGDGKRCPEHMRAHREATP